MQGTETAAQRPQTDFEGHSSGFELRLAAFLDRVPEGTLVVDESGKICLANAKVAQTFGYAPDELIGMSIEELMPADERARHRRSRADFARAPRDRTMGNGPVVLAQRQDGSCFHANIELRPRVTPTGVMVLAVVRDLGEAQPGEAGRLAREVHRRMNLVRLAAEDLLDLSAALLSVLEGVASSDPAGHPARVEEAQSTAFLLRDVAEQLASYGSEELILDEEPTAK